MRHLFIAPALLLLPRHSASKAAALHEGRWGEGASCFDAHWPQLQLDISPDAELSLWRREDFEQATAPPGQPETYSACFLRRHQVLIVQLDILEYTGNRASYLLEREIHVLTKFLDHLERNVGEERWEALTAGVAVCIPRHCAQEEDAGVLRKSSVEYIAYATGFGDSSVWLPTPRELDMNIVAQYSAFAMPAKSASPNEVPGPEFEGGCIIGRVPVTARLCWSGAAANEVLLDRLLVDGFPEAEGQSAGRISEVSDEAFDFLGSLPRKRRPPWLLCDDPSFHEAWRDWGRVLRESQVVHSGRTPRTLLAHAAKIIELFATEAWHWMATVYLHSFDLCDSDHIPADWRWNGDDFCAYHYIRDGHSDSWGGRRCWKRWAQFCPFGFVAALAVRSRGLREIGEEARALEDLRMGGAMLGSCAEFDLVGELWGGARDLQWHIVAVQRPETLAALEEVTGSQGDPLIDTTDAQRFVMWHALQLNSLVRLHLRDVARGTDLSKTPALAMLAYPSYLSLLIIPALLQVWPDLELSLFRLGRWMTHEKCPACAQLYEERFLHDEPALQELPLDFTSQPAGNVVWSADPADHGDFLVRLSTLLSHPRMHAGEVLVCAAPLWLCASLLLVNAQRKPLLSLCLMRHDLGGPPGFTASQAREVLRQDVVEPLAAAVTGGRQLRNLWVREDMARSYGNFELEEYDNFHPFVWLPSLYIEDRYSGCYDTADVVVMREGSLGRFAPTIHGHLFFSLLMQIVPSVGWKPASPWRFRLLPYTTERLSYSEIASHRAAVFIPRVWYGKLTFKDLVTMEIPLFMPDLELQASISTLHSEWGCGRWAQHETWAQMLCKAVRVTHRLPQSSFFRHPYVKRFGSAVDLVRQLVMMDCAALLQVNQDVRRWNSMLLQDDLAFWRTAIQALASGSGETASSAVAEEMDAFAKHKHHFALPTLPAPVALCELPAAAHCTVLEDPAMDSCCVEAAIVASRAERRRSVPQGAGSTNASGDATCLAQMDLCPEGQLLYGVHLLQDTPVQWNAVRPSPEHV
ncbi:unnamed protein product [Symbiodinium natans]|uniref:Uncharacterized protein n=1 Tax=Symbiodinium natans TaxID=878477 RepID=A0A812PP63_9DINO|nr:unnamed protein product [Symbiodinium natans]